MPNAGGLTWDDLGTDRYPMSEEGLTLFARDAGGGHPPYESYVLPVFPASQTLRFDGNYPYERTSHWDASLLDRPGVRSIEFGAGFDVRNQHLEDITARAALCQSLISLSLGDSDTGSGGVLTDAAVIALARACTNLKVLVLDACTRLTDRSFIAICESCQSLEMLRITGNDKVMGSLQASGLKRLAEQEGLAPRLKELTLYDQSSSLDTKSIRSLSKARTSLVIKEGNLGRGDFTSTFKGGKMVGTDMGFGEIDVSHSGMEEYEDEEDEEDGEFDDEYEDEYMDDKE